MKMFPRNRKLLVILIFSMVFLLYFNVKQVHMKQRVAKQLAAVSSASQNNHAFKRLCPVVTGFDYPVGYPNAQGYYNAQPFAENKHLGDDWNGNGGGDSDLGDPVFVIGDGVVMFAEDLKQGWGKVVRICHNIGTESKPHYVESLYAHLQHMYVQSGVLVKKGQKIATIGNAGGRYKAHLHLEIRNSINMPIGQGYSKDTTGYVDPTLFIKTHRNFD